MTPLEPLLSESSEQCQSSYSAFLPSFLPSSCFLSSLSLTLLVLYRRQAPVALIRNEIVLYLRSLSSEQCSAL
jgi:hypothetical protein